jgi:hypothetical protein
MSFDPGDSCGGVVWGMVTLSGRVFKLEASPTCG